MIIQMNLSHTISSHLKWRFAVIDYITIRPRRKTFMITQHIYLHVKLGVSNIKLVINLSARVERFDLLWPLRKRRRFLVKKPLDRHCWNNFPSVDLLPHFGISPADEFDQRLMLVICVYFNHGVYHLGNGVPAMFADPTGTARTISVNRYIGSPERIWRINITHIKNKNVNLRKVVIVWWTLVSTIERIAAHDSSKTIVLG